MTSSQIRPVIWRYVIVHDAGLAPHISGGVCSLVVCKPKIRRHAKPGEWVMAFVKAAKSNGNPLVQYVMKVADNPSFEKYCRENIGRRRDAIYRYNSNHRGTWFDNGYSDHAPTDAQKDQGGQHALVSTEFAHFGSQPRNLLLELMPICDVLGLRADTIVEELVHRTQGESKYCSPEAYKVFVSWIAGLPKDHKAPPCYPSFPPIATSRSPDGKCQ